FLSPDPVLAYPENPQDLNRYSYVWNSPLTNTDPSGKATEWTRLGVTAHLSLSTWSRSSLPNYDGRGWFSEVPFTNMQGFSFRPDLYWTDGGIGGVWELKPVSNMIGYKHDKAIMQATRYAQELGSISKFNFNQVDWGLGTSKGAPIPFYGELKIVAPHTNGFFYEFRYFIPNGREAEGLIYYDHKKLDRIHTSVGEQVQYGAAAGVATFFVISGQSYLLPVAAPLTPAMAP
ncbi:MAG: hypothetical protein Q8J78_16605, partial [Moraxellaceae bacterium]|nr:hypothetical protein [Moraxellaceae bacterium]